MNWIRKGLVALIIIGLVMLLGFTHIGRYIFWNYADIDDYRKFPAASIKNGSSNFRFTRAENEKGPVLPDSYVSAETYDSFGDFLEKNETVAFAIIRDDTIQYERFFDGYTGSSLLSSFSISKSFVSGLVGAAIADGYIRSIEQPVTDFLTGFRHPGYEEITIRHLLEMRSGIHFSESYKNPFGHAAKFYYGKNLKKYTYNLKPVEPPGTRYEYMSGNTQVLAFILEKATGTSLPEYLEEKIWKQTGMEYDASWNTDSKRHNTVKAFCCINARLYDFARFGRLYLKKGNWNGKQVLPEWWVDESLDISNNSKDDDGYPYTYSWRSLETGSFFAKGIMGQYIYVNPAKKLIILRFGRGYSGLEWAALFEKISEQY